MKTETKQYIDSALGYYGAKRRFLSQILKHFPGNIDIMVDLFAGSCTVGINVKAQKYYFNDILQPLIEFLQYCQHNDADKIINYCIKTIQKWNLQEKEGFYKFREYSNQNRHPLDILILSMFSFKGIISYNLHNKYNSSFSYRKRFLSEKKQKNIRAFVDFIRKNKIIFSNKKFSEFEYFDILTKNSLVYCDPPYRISDVVYLKYFKPKDEIVLLQTLDTLNSKGVRFALSNVTHHKGRKNEILIEWLKNNPSYRIIPIQVDYSSVIPHNLKTKYQYDPTSTREVLVINY